MHTEGYEERREVDVTGEQENIETTNVHTESYEERREVDVIGVQENIETTNHTEGYEERREVDVTGVQENIETGNEERREGVVGGEQQNHVEAALQHNERDL